MKTTPPPDSIASRRALSLIAVAFLSLAFVAGATPPPPQPSQLTLQSIYSFPSNQVPQGGLLRSSNGNFFAATTSAGSNSFGAIFAVTPEGVAGAPFYFNGNNGASPTGPLVQGRDGNLYGATSSGGTSNNGTVFRISPLLTSNSFVTLFRFGNTNGAQPSGPLLLAGNGFLYGTTFAGGGNGLGTIFGVTGSGTFSNFHAFSGTDGQNPSAGLILGKDGNLYGTTRYGGNNGLGTVFVMSPSGNLTNLASFDGTHGADPRGLTQGRDTNFYGATFSGGSADLGTLFLMTPSGSLTATSLNVPDGTNPDGPLLQAGDGSFYGLALQGGTYGIGAVFRYAPSPRGSRGPSQTFLEFIPFNGTDGAYPSGGLIQDTNGNLFGTTTYGGGNGSGTFFELTGFAPVITRAPASVPFVNNSTATFTVAAAGSEPLAFQWLLNGVPLSDQTISGTTISGSASATLRITPLTAADVGSYSVIISNPFGATSNTAMLTVPAPAVSIKPVPPLTVTTSNLAISGTAADRNLPLTGVQFQVGAVVGTAVTMNQFSNWSANLPLQPGSNAVQVWSIDQLGNSSRTNNFEVFYYVTSALTLSTTGQGTIVTPRSFNASQVIVGKTYVLKAAPASGYLFSGWTGAVTSSIPTLDFVMTPNAALAANFVTNIFTGASGVYNGLFYQDSNVTPGTGGLLSGLKINSTGAYSGKLLLAGASFAVSGVFNAVGAATNTISRAATGGGPLLLEMFLDLTGSLPAIFGTVSPLATNGARWTAHLTAEPQTASRGSAEYTILLQPGRGANAGPPSAGYALLTNHQGTATFAGALPDGTPLTQTVPLSALGDAPFYDSLDGGAGVVIGWITNLNRATPAGSLTWITPANAPALYPAGLTNSLVAQGAIWTNPPKGTPPISLPNGQLTISGGFLASPLTYSVTVNTANALVVSSGGSANSLAGTINPKTGLLTLSFGNGNGRATTAAQGAVLQDQSIGAGFFTTKTNSGAINLGPSN